MGYEKDPRVCSCTTAASWPDPDGIVTAGHGNTTGRQISYREGAPVDEPALTRYLRHIIADNRAGGWRRIKAARARG
jgi:hypothetical protein